MKLKSFRIKNYKSIIDSGECILSELDSVTILAGQNESGKSSILQALRDFHNDEFSSDSIRIEEEIPEIVCTYSIEAGDILKIIDYLKETTILPVEIEKYIKTLKSVSMKRVYENFEVPHFDLSEEIVGHIENLKNLEIEKLKTISKEASLEIELPESTSEEESEMEDEEIEDSDEVEEDETDDDDKSKNSKALLTALLVKKANESENALVDVNSIEFEWEIVNAFDFCRPVVIFFDDFCDLLPDKILVSDLVSKSTKASGYQAVKNIETILKEDFTKLDKLGDAQRVRRQDLYHKTITANFNEKWTQKIAEDNLVKIHIRYEQGKAANASYLNFFIETKDAEYLPPRQRSQGFRWFLSFYLHLKAESERNSSLIILFDEPGLYLHSKAQNDMVKVFEELAEKNQIIYTTHSPYLIDAGKLHRVKLIINTQEYGTTIEKITTSKIKDQRDSLKPIIDAVGLEIAHNFSVARKKNVIIEGISDFYYMEAFRQIFGKKEEYAFVPAMGASNVHLLMELCIGWGLDWLIVFDEKGITRDYNKIKKSFFNNDEDDTNKKILKLNGFDGIEDLFDDVDMQKVLPDVEYKAGQKKGDFVATNGGKELAARLFLEKVNKNQFKEDDFSEKTIKNFRRVFDFVSEKFGFKK